MCTREVGGIRRIAEWRNTLASHRTARVAALSSMIGDYDSHYSSIENLWIVCVIQSSDDVNCRIRLGQSTASVHRCSPRRLYRFVVPVRDRPALVCRAPMATASSRPAGYEWISGRIGESGPNWYWQWILAMDIGNSVCTIKRHLPLNIICRIISSAPFTAPVPVHWSLANRRRICSMSRQKKISDLRRTPFAGRHD